MITWAQRNCEADGLTWYVLILIAFIVWAGVTGKFDSSPRLAEKPVIPPLSEDEKKNISDRYEQAITAITANYQKHYHKNLPNQEAISIYMQCRQVRNYPPLLRKDYEHLLEYICPSSN